MKAHALPSTEAACAMMMVSGENDAPSTGAACAMMTMMAGENGAPNMADGENADNMSWAVRSVTSGAATKKVVCCTELWP